MDSVERFAPIHPGEILKDILDDMNISQSRLAGDLDIPVSRIHEIVKGKRAVTLDTAVRLAEYFGGTVGRWLNLQSKYDLETLERSGELDTIKLRIRKQAV